MIVDLVYLAFAVFGVASFRWLAPSRAVAAVVLGGWVLLPVGHYPPGAAEVVFPYWITGLAVPSDMLLTKAWIAPLVAALGASVFDRRTLGALRPGWVDLPMAAWCLWPWLESVAVAQARPDGASSTLYLVGCWGLPWLLGRAYFSTPAGRLELARAMVASALVCLPFAAIEGAVGPQAYGWAYEPHPFRFDGATRYFGYRPIGFFEHGNQYGLWMSLCALVSLWLLGVAEPGRGRQMAAMAAVGCTGMALAAQSAGGLALLCLGAALLGLAAWITPRRAVAAFLSVLLVGGGVYVSGVVPIMKIGRDTAIGQHVVSGLRAVGRGSFAWRVSQDQKLLKDATRRPLTGEATWDWWRPHDIRPWGLSVLVLGQFGMVGLLACFGSWLWTALRAAWLAPRASGWRPGAAPLMLATVVVLAVFDALMNSFIFWPSILVAGSLAGALPEMRATGPRRRGEVTRIARRGAA